MGCCALCCRICNALVAEGGSLELLIGRHWALCGDLLGWRPHIHNGGGGGLQGGDGGSHWGGRQHNGGMQLHWKLLGHLRHPCYSDGGAPPGRILAHLWEQGHSVVLCEIFKCIKNSCIFFFLVWVSWGQNVNFCRANWTCFFLCESVGDSSPKGERERVK